MKKTSNYTPRRIALGQAVLLGLVALTGCRAPQGTPANSFTADEGDTELEAIQGSKSLTRALEIVHFASERRDDRLHVQFDLRNKRQTDLALEWQIAWFDASGFVLDSPASWRPLVIGGKAFQRIAATGPTPEATSFQLQTRKPNTVH